MTEKTGNRLKHVFIQFFMLKKLGKSIPKTKDLVFSGKMKHHTHEPILGNIFKE